MVRKEAEFPNSFVDENGDFKKKIIGIYRDRISQLLILRDAALADFSTDWQRSEDFVSSRANFFEEKSLIDLFKRGFGAASESQLGLVEVVPQLVSQVREKAVIDESDKAYITGAVLGCIFWDIRYVVFAFSSAERIPQNMDIHIDRLADDLLKGIVARE